MPPTSQPRRVSTAGLLMAVAGILLLAVLVYRVGPADIANGFRQIGIAGLFVVVLLGGMRFAARALAWTLCVEPPHRLPFREAFNALLCGDTLGNVMVLGPIISEPAKLAYIRQRVPLGPAVTALAIENMIYTLSVAAVIAAGGIALLFAFDLPAELRVRTELALTAIAVAFAVVVWMIWRRPALLSRALPWIARGQTRVRVNAKADGLRTLEQDIYTFASRRRAVVAPIIVSEFAFHALGVAEMYATLWMLQAEPPSLLVSFVLEAGYRLITVAFKFVPFQSFVGEITLGGLTSLLGMGTIGVTVSLVRKVRMIAWALVGTVLLARRGLNSRRILDDETLQVR